MRPINQSGTKNNHHRLRPFCSKYQPDTTNKSTIEIKTTVDDKRENIKGTTAPKTIKPIRRAIFLCTLNHFTQFGILAFAVTFVTLSIAGTSLLTVFCWLCSCWLEDKSMEVPHVKQTRQSAVLYVPPQLGHWYSFGILPAHLLSEKYVLLAYTPSHSQWYTPHLLLKEF